MKDRKRPRHQLQYLVATTLALILLALAACGDTKEMPTVTSELTGPEGQKYGGTIRVAMSGDVATLDPPLLTHTPDIAVVRNTYDMLLTRNPDLSLQPMLAVSWEPNEDATAWTFHLREGVKFSDGRGYTKDFKAEDVVYTFNRLFEVDSPLASVLSDMKREDGSANIVVLDDYTVRFDLIAPNAFIPELLLRHQAHITPSDVPPRTWPHGRMGQALS